ncbi:FecR domain-containing protein [Chitinophaga pendula]|uniref:FecR family protein n=1 Tax=Chitinophaga TaxID=79328 RepID=UPI000BB0AFF2|nr:MULTISPECIES: FecR domain-containing protein [Chitinophaga]ASZ11682.1 hypothetical protein CK934_12275 [Chitinophaga sp. MD30]UCJ05305.1 FecR domain-containing protein [Chitinophaga pendula]
MVQSPFDSEMLDRFFSGTSAAEEHEVILQWLQGLTPAEQDNFFQYHLSRLAELSPVEGEGVRPSFAKLRAKLQSDRHRSEWFRRAGMVAAAGLIGWSIWFMPVRTAPEKNGVQPIAQHVTPAGEQLVVRHNTSGHQQRIVLPDASVALLSADASIRYPAAFKQDRRIGMSGTVYFDVQKDPQHPFIVRAGKMETRVLGTSFTIQAGERSKEWSIAVHSGKVQVDVGQQPPLLLAAGDKADYQVNAGTLVKHTSIIRPKTVPAPVIKEWTAIAFDQTPLKTVAKAIAEKYQVTVTIRNKELEERPVSLSIKQQTLPTLLEELKARFNISYEITGEQVIIY